MNPRTPTGFYVASVCAASFGALMTAMMLVMDQGGGSLWGAIPGRAAAALLAALSAVTAEALWCARPWAWRASLALAVSYAAVVLSLCIAEDGGGGLFAAFWILFSTFMVVGPLLLYIRKRSAGLFGPLPAYRHPMQPPPAYGPPPLHHPAPPPQPLPAGRRPPPWW